MKKAFLFAVVVGICMILSTTVTAQPIKVGAVINLTGPASSYGQYHAKGLQDYFRYVNEVKGGVAGRKVELTIVDHAYQVPEAIKLVKKFCEDKVDMLAVWDAGSGIAVKPILQQYKIPAINFSTYQALLNQPIEYMYIVFGSYIMESMAVLDYIKAIHKGKEPPRVGLLTYNNAFGKAIHAPCKEYAVKANVNIVSVEEFPSSTLDLGTELLRLKEKKAEYIFIQALPAAIVAALKAADRVGYNVPFFGTNTSTDPDFFKLGHGLIRDRLAISFGGALPVDNTPGIKLMQDLWKRYKTVDKFDTCYWLGVTVGAIMERSMERANQTYKKINAETINNAMEFFRNEDFGGLVPNVTYTKTNHEPSFSTRIVRVREDSSYAPLSNFFHPGKDKVQVLKESK
jgi:branched-chain amino acid transport system substrate-binding protein